MSDLGKNLQKLIKEKGLSNRAVSLATGKSAQLVADIISGRSKSPSIETITALAKVLEVPVHKIMGREPDYAPDVNILAACFQWVLENIDKLSVLPTSQIMQELMKQYSRMLNDKIDDKGEAVRLTRYVFETLIDKPRKRQK